MKNRYFAAFAVAALVSLGACKQEVEETTPATDAGAPATVTTDTTMGATPPMTTDTAMGGTAPMTTDTTTTSGATTAPAAGPDTAARP